MHLAFALPEPAKTGGGGGAHYINSLAPALRALGHQIDVITGDHPAFPPGAVPVIDGMLLPLLHPHLDAFIAADSLVLVHHVSAAAGRDEGDRERIRIIEREMLPRMRRAIATSQPVAARLQTEFGLAASTVPPGAHDLPRTLPDPDDPVILAVGVLTRRKGHDLLLRAAERLTDLPWRLVIAGDAGREPAHPAQLAALAEELGLANRTTLLADPSPDALERAWSTATVFALATRWEGYPSAVAEALRRGIPPVVTDGGDAGALVGAGTGAVCPVDDLATFGKCLRRLLFDRDLRADMAEAAWQAGQKLPSWNQRAQEFLAILEN
jgi:glycosyltransferase involved in cell wall biosynthesis